MIDICIMTMRVPLQMSGIKTHIKLVCDDHLFMFKFLS